MPAKESIHFSLVAQLASSYLYPDLVRPDPVSESPPLTKSAILSVGSGRTCDRPAIRVPQCFHQLQDSGVPAANNTGDSNAKSTSVRSNLLSQSRC
jgi:hypothetical protein